jgi:hypothetical protein
MPAESKPLAPPLSHKKKILESPGLASGSHDTVEQKKKKKHAANKILR